MDKQALRQQLKSARLALSNAEVIDKSKAIIDKLFQVIDWQNIKTLHCYLPIEQLREIDTRPLFEFIWSQRPEVMAYTTTAEGQCMLVRSEFLLEPANEKIFDVIVVPMLGFDASLNRIGYGGGYYDRFLSAQPQAQKIGLCFESGRIEKLPQESHDIALDMIITEKP